MHSALGPANNLFVVVFDLVHDGTTLLVADCHRKLHRAALCRQLQGVARQREVGHCQTGREELQADPHQHLLRREAAKVDVLQDRHEAEV